VGTTIVGGKTYRAKIDELASLPRGVVGAVDPLITDRVVALDTFRGIVGQLELEVVDLLEHAFLTRLVLVVLVRRVRRPVARRADRFSNDESARITTRAENRADRSRPVI
jgi:hypothetical protein